jgi:hypothetical protein
MNPTRAIDPLAKTVLPCGAGMVGQEHAQGYRPVNGHPHARAHSFDETRRR